MKVIWGYSEKIDTERLSLQKNSTTQASLILSAVSWMKFAPNVTRILYTDRSTCNFLLKNDLTDLWDEVIVVEFVKDLVLRWGISSSTMIPYYICTLQEDSEPFWYSSYNMVLLGDFHPTFNTNACSIYTKPFVQCKGDKEDVDGKLLQTQDFFINRENSDQVCEEFVASPSVFYFNSGNLGKVFGTWALGTEKISKAWKFDDFFDNSGISFGTFSEYFQEIEIIPGKSTYSTVISLEQRIGVDVLHSYPRLFGKKTML